MAKYLTTIAAAGVLGLGAILACGEDPVEPKNQMPVAEASIDPMQGYSPLTVNFDGSASYDPDGAIVKYIWDFGDGVKDSTSGAMANHIYETPGSYTSGLTVADNSGGRNSKTLEDIKATQPPVNNPPQTSLDVSPTSGVVPLNVRVQYSCTDADPDDIAQSYVVVGRDTVTTTSIDSIFTFTEPGTYTTGAYCRDKAGAESTEGPINVEVTQPPVNNPPQTSLTVTPLSGVVPLNVRVQYGCTDSDPDDIAQSYVVVGRDTVTTTSIDSTFTFTEPGTYTTSAYCRDKAGAESIEGPVNVEVTQPPVNNPPQTTLTVNPTSGVSPLEVRVQYACTDQDGIEDIARSNLIVGTDTIPTTSIDTTFVFTQTTPVGAECEDKAGAESTKGPINVEVTQPPQQDQIAFRSFLAGSSFSICGLCDDIYIMDDNGENLRRLTTNKGEEMEPTWSPDGTRIAYAAISQGVGEGDPVNGNNGLFVINSDGTGEEQLYGLGVHNFARYPDWSPDGSKIAFTYLSLKENSDEDRNGIAVIDLESRVVTRLTEDPCPRCFANGSPSWSPDGSRIVFDALRNNSNDIWIMNADGSGQEKIYSGGMMPDWSSDRLEIVFVSPIDEPKIHIMKIDDGSVTQIINDPSFRNYHPDWSPDGNKIVFAGGAPGAGVQIYTINKDGSELTHLPVLAHSESPAFRPRQ